MKKLTTEEFISKAKKIHGEKYDYSKTTYTNKRNKVEINCIDHGIFIQLADSHLAGNGCPECGKTKKIKNQLIDINKVIKQFKETHGDKYDYSQLEYKGMKKKSYIICKEHGGFWQQPYSHIIGQGCPKCGKIELSKKLFNTKDDIIERANKIHNNKYNYSKFEYKGLQKKSCIICPIHGEFWQKTGNHINGSECPECAAKTRIDKSTLKIEQFISKANKIHNNKYDYKDIRYSNGKSILNIICKKHGHFKKIASVHIQGQGCPLCSKEELSNKYRRTLSEFIDISNNVHGNKYDYSNVDYKNSHTKICITCPRHGNFWQKPYTHINGTGCPICNESKLEKEIRILLNNNNISFEYQKRFKWLKQQSLDFYLPDYNIAIECQGIQHFESVEFFGGENGLKNIIERDIKKKILCNKHSIKLLYYSEIIYNENIINDTNYLIKKIKEE